MFTCKCLVKEGANFVRTASRNRSETQKRFYALTVFESISGPREIEYPLPLPPAPANTDTRPIILRLLQIFILVIFIHVRALYVIKWPGNTPGVWTAARCSGPDDRGTFEPVSGNRKLRLSYLRPFST